MYMSMTYAVTHIACKQLVHGAALHTLSKLITVCPVPVLALPQHTFDKVQVHEKSEVAAAATPCSASLASSHVVSAVSLCQAQQWVCNPSPV